ncbi:hypothetical protein SLITK23_62500 [Streptomyces lividans]|nr:predicted protein [Streptomyces lividans TK24]BDE43005.1 hypothetical protein SLITK23_62500 [Streptomyces lividans]GHA76140.1 hypothetical protein GCM10010391_71850 [Streptomyces anthocyanicus]GHC07351.1 hypothetical protein GCM10010348_31400 [Streptomyces anthocyanicus]
MVDTSDPLGVCGQCVRPVALPHVVRAEGEVLGCDKESFVLIRWRRGDAEVQRGEADRYATSTEPVLPTSGDC